jgi:CheY-like chemotaxis protein/HPt (histidine-containing phosphotransfer) domain-containing protein
MRDQDQYDTRMKLTEAERESLLNRLDQAARTEPQGDTGKNNRRRHKRWEFRVPNTGLTVEHPGGGVSRLMVCARNLSAGGVGFIHGGYLHKGSRCKVLLRGLDGAMHPVGGQIVSCRHVEGVMHEIGLQFERKIDPTKFVSAPVSPPSPAESIGLETLYGKVLYIDDSVDDQNLMKFVLDLCGAQLCSASNGVEGLAIAEQRQFDAILAEMWLPGISGIEIGEALRKAGYAGPIIAITADEQPQLKEQALAKGFTDFLLKPLDFEQLSKMLARHLPIPPELGANTQPLYSIRWEDVRMRPLILDFISRLPSQMKQLEKFLESSDPANAQKLCMSLKGSAGGYGFPQLTAAAEELRKQIAAGAKLIQLKSPMDHLRRLCAAATMVREKEDLAA